MLNQVFLWAVVCVAVAVGQLDHLEEYVGDDRPRPKPQRPCCFPEEWEASIGEGLAFYDAKKGGAPGTAGVLVPKMALDYKRGRVAAFERIFSKGKEQSLSVVGDVKKGSMYIIQWHEKTCKRVAFKKMSDRCLPKEAKFLHRLRLGAGEHAEEVDAWAMKVHQDTPQKMDVEATILLQARTCVPVLENARAKTGDVDVLFSALFFNVRMGIRDPRVFEVPKFCNNATTVHDPQLTPFLSYVHRKVTAV